MFACGGLASALGAVSFGDRAALAGAGWAIAARVFGFAFGGLAFVCPTFLLSTIMLHLLAQLEPALRASLALPS